MVYLSEPPDFNSKFDIVSCYLEHTGKILLLKRSAFKPEGSKWDRPAGKASPGEDLKAATLREMKEEIGLELQPTDLKSYKKVYVRYPTYDYVFHMFRAVLPEEPTITLNEEHDEFQWLKPEDALKLNLIRDEDTCIQLFYGIKTSL